MDGDIAPLPALSDIAARDNLLLMVDDAHGEGALGRGGRGIVDYPTVPRGKARIRVMISASHSRKDLEKGVEVFAQVGRELKVT